MLSLCEIPTGNLENSNLIVGGIYVEKFSFESLCEMETCFYVWFSFVNHKTGLLNLISSLKQK